MYTHINMYIHAEVFLDSVLLFEFAKSRIDDTKEALKQREVSTMTSRRNALLGGVWHVRTHKHAARSETTTTRTCSQLRCSEGGG